MFLKQVSAVLLLAGLSAAAAATEVPVQKGAKAASEAKADDLVCTYEQPVGSHLKKRVCATRGQRQARAEADRNVMQGGARKSGGGGTMSKQ